MGGRNKRHRAGGSAHAASTAAAATAAARARAAAEAGAAAAAAEAPGGRAAPRPVPACKEPRVKQGEGQRGWGWVTRCGLHGGASSTATGLEAPFHTHRTETSNCVLAKGGSQHRAGCCEELNRFSDGK